MNALLRLTLPLLALGFVMVSPSRAENQPPLDGEWVVTAALRDGKPTDARNFEGMRWTFGKETLQITAGKNTPAGLSGKADLKCTYTVDNAQTPAHFDWTLHSSDKKHVVHAIYEQAGDVFRLAFAPREQPRPTSFDTTSGKWVVYEFKRVAAKGDRD